MILPLLLLLLLPRPSWSSHSLGKSRQINVTGGERPFVLQNYTHTHTLGLLSSQLNDWDCQSDSSTAVERTADTPSALFPPRRALIDGNQRDNKHRYTLSTFLPE